jgi:hypothetical protein
MQPGRNPGQVAGQLTDQAVSGFATNNAPLGPAGLRAIGE